MEDVAKARVQACESRNGGFIHRCVIVLPLVLLPIFAGGAPPWFWSVCAAFILVGAIYFIWNEQYGSLLSAISPKVFFILAPFFVYPFLQVIPLPEAWVSFLSPQRLIWIKRAEEVTGLKAMATSISYVPLTTVFTGLFLISLGVYALLLNKALQHEKQVDWLFLTLFFFIGLESFYGLLQVFIPSFGTPFDYDPSAAHMKYARGTFANRNHFAAFLGMSLPVLLMYVLSLDEKSRRSRSLSYAEKERREQIRQKQAFMSFILGLVLLALVFSRSRGGILATMISFTVLIALGGIRRGAMAAFIAICWMIVLGYGGIIGFDQIIARFDLMEKNAPVRFQIWEDTMRMIEDHSLVGIGMGAYRTTINLYQSHFSDQYLIGEAHNDYLELVAEAGLPVAACAILLVWGYWWKTALRIRREIGEVRLAELEARKARRHERRSSSGGLPVRSERVNEESRVESNGSRRHERRDLEEERLRYELRRAEQKRLLTIGALAGSAAFLCHIWVEFNWQMPANQLYFIMLMVLMRR